MFADVGERTRRPAAGLRRIVPTPVMAQHQLVTEPGIQHTQDALDVGLVFGGIADAVVLQPRAAPRHFEVQVEIRLSLGVNPDEALRRVSGSLDDVELIAHDTPPDRVAADDGVRRGTCSRRGAENLRLAIGDAVVASAELDPRRPHAGILDLALQLRQHPVAQFLFAGGVCPGGNPRLAVDASGDNDGKIRGFRNRAHQINAPPHPDGAALHEHRHTHRARLLDLGLHQRDHASRLNQHVHHLLRRAHIHEDMLVGQDHAYLSGRFRAERRQ